MSTQLPQKIVHSTIIIATGGKQAFVVIANIIQVVLQ
jgi:hypothetical protein